MAAQLSDSAHNNAPHALRRSARDGPHASALLETGIVETIHPALARKYLPARARAHAPGGVQGQRGGIRLAGEEGRDLRGVLPLEHGTGDVDRKSTRLN